MDRTNFQWTPDFWQGWRESENPYRRHKSNRDRSLALRFLRLSAGERVLEVGCGYGWISRAIWDAAKVEWVGVDRSMEMVQQLRGGPSEQAGNSSVVDATSLPFRDDCFDKVLCTGVLMHIAQDTHAVREMIRVLRPGGLLLCSFNNALSPFSLAVRVWNLRKKGFVQKFRLPGSVRRTLREYGVETSDVAGDGIISTVPISAGGFSIPPVFAFRSVREIDEWAVERLPWLAYEVWFSGTKSVRR
jgi:SAM-dependent methyltransferase